MIKNKNTMSKSGDKFIGLLKVLFFFVHQSLRKVNSQQNLLYRQKHLYI